MIDEMKIKRIMERVKQSEFTHTQDDVMVDFGSIVEEYGVKYDDLTDEEKRLLKREFMYLADEYEAFYLEDRRDEDEGLSSEIEIQATLNK